MLTLGFQINVPSQINVPPGSFSKINKHNPWKMLVKSQIVGLFIREKQVKMPLRHENFKLYESLVPNKALLLENLGKIARYLVYL